MKIKSKLNIKYVKLQSVLKEMQKVVLAYSGGVDSTFLLKVCIDILGKNCIAVLGISPSLAQSEYRAALNLAESIGANLVTITTNELNDKNYLSNDFRRCFYCKYELFLRLTKYAAEHEIKYVLDGSNAEDIEDYRPGMEAAGQLKIRSPLIEANLNKEEIRLLSNYLKLPTWDKPAQPCLSSRIAYGNEISPEILHKIDQAEQVIKRRGFKIVRVRYFGSYVSVEVGAEEIYKLQNGHEKSLIIKRLKKIGFGDVRFDEEGYRSGKLNRILAAD